MLLFLKLSPIIVLPSADMCGCFFDWRYYDDDLSVLFKFSCSMNHTNDSYINMLGSQGLFGWFYTVVLSYPALPDPPSAQQPRGGGGQWRNIDCTTATQYFVCI